MTFEDVTTRSDADLTAGTNFIIPFIRFVAADAACTSHCAVGSVDYQWMKHTNTGWTLATADELSVVVSDLGGYLSIRPNTDSSPNNIGIVIPPTAPSGTIAWAAQGNILTGITETQMKALTPSDLCHVGLSYDDKLGMRFFAGITNDPGTCL
jgi:hypothetical protein